MKTLIFILLFSMSVSAQTLRVAVIDTGLPKQSSAKWCKEGHTDLSNTTLTDEHGHATNVAGLIAAKAGNTDYCLIALKFYGKKSNIQGTIAAFRKAIELKVDIINYSAGGVEYSREEALVIQQALNLGIKIVVAAGNEKQDFSQKCEYYPACYDNRLIVVGCMTSSGKTCNSSNFGGNIDVVINGDSRTADGITMTGTSQATGVATGLLIKKLHDRSKK